MSKKEKNLCPRCGMPWTPNRDGVCMYCGAVKKKKLKIKCNLEVMK